MNVLGPSWKTTFGGTLSLIGGCLLVVPDNAPGASYVKPWAGFITAIGAGLVGLFARDNKVSSEEAGAAKPAVTVTATPPTPPVP